MDQALSQSKSLLDWNILNNSEYLIKLCKSSLRIFTVPQIKVQIVNDRYLLVFKGQSKENSWILKEQYDNGKIMKI